MQISELIAGLEIVKNRYGDCVVMVADENYDPEIALSNLELSEAELRMPNGKTSGVALLEVVKRKSKKIIEPIDDEEDEEISGLCEEEEPEKQPTEKKYPDFIQAMEPFHEQVVRGFETHLSRLEKDLENLKKNSQKLTLKDEKQ